MKKNTKYVHREWLNDINSPQIGNIVAYDGDLEFNDGLHHSTFLSISDCHSTIRLHKSEYDTETEFIKKMKNFRGAIDNFIEYLESEYIHGRNNLCLRWY